MTALASMLAKKLRPSTRQEIERAAKGTGRRSDLSFEEAGLAGEVESLRKGAVLARKAAGKDKAVVVVRKGKAA